MSAKYDEHPLERDFREWQKDNRPAAQTPPEKPPRPEPDDPLEAAFWAFDAARKAGGERLAFKNTVRALHARAVEAERSLEHTRNTERGRAERAEARVRELEAAAESGQGRDAALDENDRLRRSLAEDADEIGRLMSRARVLESEREEAMRRATDSTEVVRNAHAESARLRGFAAGWLYIVEDALERDGAGQERALKLLRDQMRRALAGQQRLIAEARRAGRELAPADPPGPGLREAATLAREVLDLDAKAKALYGPNWDVERTDALNDILTRMRDIAPPIARALLSALSAAAPSTTDQAQQEIRKRYRLNAQTLAKAPEDERLRERVMNRDIGALLAHIDGAAPPDEPLYPKGWVDDSDPQKALAEVMGHYDNE